MIIQNGDMEIIGNIFDNPKLFDKLTYEDFGELMDKLYDWGDEARVWIATRF